MRLRFLSLEDNPLDADMIEVMLLNGGIDCELCRVKTRSSFISALETEAFDLILADYALPNFDGLAALDLIRDLRPEIPFVFVSGSLGEELAIESLKRGATDYVLKQRLGRLVPCVQRALQEAQERRERQRAEAALRESETRLRFMLDATQVGHWDLDLTTEPYTAYRSLRHDQIFGYESPLPEWSYEIFLTHVHPDDRAAMNEHFQQMLSASTDWNFECRIIHLDHSVHWIWVRSSVYCDSSDTPTRLLGMVVDITERKAVEAALRESEARLRKVAANLPNGAAFILDHGLRYLLAEGEALRNAGFTSEDLVGKTLWEALNFDLVAQYEPHYRQALEGEPFSIEHQSHDRDYISHGAPLYNEQGDVEAVLSVSYDISERKRVENERKQAEAALQASEAKIRSILESIADGFFALDQDWRFTYVNPQAERILNRTPGDLLNQVIWDVYPGTVGMEFERAYRQTASERVASSFVSFYPDHNCWYEVYAYPAADGITVYFRNVTDRIQTEATLRESEERYRTLFESIDQGFCLVEVLFDADEKPFDYRFAEVNEPFEQQSGLVNAVGKTILELVPNFEPQWAEQYGQVGKSGKAIRFEADVVSMNRIFDIYAFPSGAPGENLVAVLFADITDRKRAEAEREELLQREQAAREAAETANRIKDEFLAVLSHELRSPLNPILGWAKLLQQGNLNPERTTTALEIIERNAQLQAQLINDLLDISRILQGKLSLDQSSVDLSFVISSALETVNLAAEAKSLQIEATISSQVRTVMGDAGRLQQAVWNLLSNAVKFTPQDGQITVALTQTDTHAQIQVTDTGKGIDPEFLPYVFEHFRQEDGATTRRFGGLGLGLAIARQIIEMHGGELSAHSLGEGQGATFTVQLPLLGSRAQPGNVSAPTPPVSLTDLSILVIDDELDSRDLIAFVLEQAGATVTSVASGLEALQTVEQSLPDIIVSDIGMPDMDGYMVLQQIRMREAARPIPAIALTAYAGEFDRQQALKSGFQQHIAKPVEAEKLMRAIAVLTGRESRG